MNFYISSKLLYTWVVLTERLTLIFVLGMSLLVLPIPASTVPVDQGAHKPQTLKLDDDMTNSHTSANGIYKIYQSGCACSPINISGSGLATQNMNGIFAPPPASVLVSLYHATLPSDCANLNLIRVGPPHNSEDLGRNLHQRFATENASYRPHRLVRHASSCEASSSKDRLDDRRGKQVDGNGNGKSTRTIAAVYRPIQDDKVVSLASVVPSNGNHQAFGGDVRTAHRLAIPVGHTRTSSPFGGRLHPVTGVRHNHGGIDLAAPTGTPVAAVSIGMVEFIGRERGYGKYIIVRHVNNYRTLYAHLSAFEPRLRVGVIVRRGQPIGAVGRTGMATGPHLHFEVRYRNKPIDPTIALH
ncbi:M23 family metallopeptidase [Burkholderia territorii]|uniref:M23 family metallopeptidase n=1 Tax=Burkholderia territorii TaxID=1503055 RepID=UPI0009C02EAC|nr:M23 family metallopeptidase [Burkholderia territorii]